MEPLSIVYFAALLANAASNIYNGILTREQQEKRNLQNQEFNAKMEANRQDFNLRTNQENAKRQRESNEQNHQLRLQEQQNSFKLNCQSIEWQHVLSTWPLRVKPGSLRRQQIHKDGSIAMCVLFSKSSNQFFSQYVYPEIEQGLQEFVDCYNNIFFSHNIIFCHNAYKDGAYGGAHNFDIISTMENFPGVIIDANVLVDEICVAATVWGFGGDHPHVHETIFTLPYSSAFITTNGKINMAYVKKLSNNMLAHLKFVLGYIYDIYNLAVYEQTPLLPKVARYELEHDVKSSPLCYEDIKDSFKAHYREIYLKVLGAGELNAHPGIAGMPDSFKKTILHNIRLEYANNVKEFVSQEDYLGYLDESVMAWCDLRTTEKAVDFIKSMNGNRQNIIRYFSVQDAEYFKTLCGCYRETGEPTSLGKTCILIEKDVMECKNEMVDFEARAETNPVPSNGIIEL